MPLIEDPQGRSVVPIVIENKALPLDPSRIFPVISSKTDETVHHYQGTDIATCDKACEAAWAAFRTWKRASIGQRRDLLLRVAALFEERADELVRVQKLETSCHEDWARNNVALSVAYVKEIAACISSIRGTIPQTEKPDTMTFVYKEAIGPILVIPPWNAALILATRAVSSAIGAGCTVVLKASELSPLTHAMIFDAFRDAGCPSGVLNSLQASRQDAAAVTEALIANERIRKIEFIGSAAVGRIIGATAAKHLKPVLMELGGKCPSIVLDDANLQKAAILSAKGALLHHGQICFGTERIIVHRAVADKFIELLVKHALEVLQDAKDKGAKFLYGSPEYAGKNAVKPALVQVDASASKDHLRIVDEETFGPSASVYIVDSDEEAIAIANRSAYGLNATIHTKNLERAIKMGRELEYGQVHANSISVYTSPTGPQGGVKGSGWGRQNASWGLEEFYVARHISWHGESSG
ncbi:hypothetical protein MBLNU459_g2227t1 [Dothideomycetes sp. NU459]